MKIIKIKIVGLKWLLSGVFLYVLYNFIRVLRRGLFFEGFVFCFILEFFFFILCFWCVLDGVEMVVLFCCCYGFDDEEV